MIVDRLLRSALIIAANSDAHESIDPTDLTDALEVANMMLKSWATRGVIVHQVVTAQHQLVEGQSTYSIGASADFNTARPNRIVGGFFRLGGIDYPMTVIGRDDYNGIPIKTVPGIPQYLYYYPSFPTATITLFYVPNDDYIMSLDSLQPITELALDTELNLPPEYEEAIKWNLIVRLSPMFRTTLRPEVVQLAENSYRALSVQPIPSATFDGAPGKKVYYGAGSINTL